MKKFIVFCFIAIIQSGIAQQPKKMTEKFFPDPEFEINTPSFNKKNFVNYKELIQYIEKEIACKDFVSLQYIGETQKGNKIPAVVFKNPNSKIKVMFTGRIHGDEPAGTEALLFLIHKLVSDPEFAQFKENMDIAILPMVNIDGGERFRRLSNNGLDLNRDMSKLATPETVALRKFANEFIPDVYVDLHEYNPFRNDYMKFGEFGVTGFADIMFLYCENANYPEPLRTFFKEYYLPNYQKILTDNGLTHYKYFTSDKVKGDIVLTMGGGSPRSSSTAFGLTNAISLLVEIRGVGLGKTSFKRRVLTSYLATLSTLKSSLEKSAEIKSKIEEAINSHNKIIVTENRKITEKTIPFIDIQKNELIEVTTPVRDIADRTPAIIRERPKAYAILPQYPILAEKLQQMGVSVETLQEEQVMSGESYTITQYKKGNTQFENFFEQIVETQLQQKSITLPKGTFIINMDQRNANLAAVALEPEAENGFIRYNVLPTENGVELPIYRISNK